MRFCILTTDGEVFEVTNLFNAKGDEVDTLESAESCVVKLADDRWQALPIDGGIIHRVN